MLSHSAHPSRAARVVVAALAALLLAAPSLALPVTGVVVDRAGKPVEYATVLVPALKRGGVTDESGRFTLDLPEGTHLVEASQLGYEKVRVSVAVAAGSPELRLVLRDEPIPLAEVSVTASGFGKTGKGEGATLRRMDVYTTPGGAADVFQSLRTLPGINAPNEGAAVYVRGGPPDETLIRLDGGEMGHPYHYEGAGGGLFSALDSYMLRSAFFSSGGFSAKYGGVLSGVLDIETQDPLDLRSVGLTAHMAGGGGSTSWAIVPSRLSLVGAWRMSDPQLLFRLYGSANDYEVSPTGTDAAQKLIYRYSRSGRLALLYLDSRDRTQFEVSVLNTRADYSQRARSQLGGLQFSDAIGNVLALRGQVSGQYWQRNWRFGPYRGGQAERNRQANLDAVLTLGRGHEVSFGANLRHRDAEIDDHGAADSTDYSSNAVLRHYVSRSRVDYPGVYLEDKLRLFGPVYATLGARADRASNIGEWTLDPRAALAWRVDSRQILRLATGRYHQLPRPQYQDPVYGNPRIGPMAADHVIAGYEWKSDHSNVRAEVYRKDYHDLITNDAATFYANGGHGYARGVDLYAQGNVKWLSGWISYGWLDTRRKEFSTPTETATPYGVRHSLTLVGSYQYNSAWQVGGRYSGSSGRPYTPVAGAAFDGARWVPAYAEDYSGHMPAFHRLDLRITHLFSLPARLGLPESGVCVAFCEGLNVLNIRNVLDYTYSEDYTRRFEQESYFGRRMLVVGFGLTW